MKKLGIVFLIAALIFTNGCSLLFGRNKNAAGGDFFEQFGRKRTQSSETAAPTVEQESASIDAIDPYEIYQRKITSYSSLPVGMGGGFGSEDVGNGFRLSQGRGVDTVYLYDLLSEEVAKKGTAFAYFYEDSPVMMGYSYGLKGDARFSAQKAFADILDGYYGSHGSLQDRQDISPVDYEYTECAKLSSYSYWMDGDLRIELLVYPPEVESNFHLVFTETGRLPKQITKPSVPQPTAKPEPTPEPPKNPYSFKAGEMNDSTFFIMPEEVLALPNAQQTQMEDATRYSAPVFFMNREGILNVYADESVFCTEYLLEYTEENRDYTDNVLLLQALIREVEAYLGKDHDAVLKNFLSEAEYTDMLNALNHTKTGDTYEMIWYVGEMADISVGVRTQDDGSGSVWVSYNSYL